MVLDPGGPQLSVEALSIRGVSASVNKGCFTVFLTGDHSGAHLFLILKVLYC